PNYDMDISRKMVQGVDIWLNTPTRPLEASGTSGEKAVMNGVMQFSVLDGWWVEGYKEGAGWMLPMERTYTDQNHQNELDAEMIYRTIEEEIVPLYYDRDEEGMPRGWIKSMKSCIADIASEFTTNRMLTDYEERFYNPLYARHREIIKGDYLMAREIAAWKRKVSAAWDKVKVLSTRQADMSKQTMYVGGKYRFEATLDIAGLQPEDIGVELLLASQIESGQDVKIADKIQLEVVSTEGSKVVYAVDATMEHTGSYDAALRVYPKNPKLPNRMDFALVKWA
ncbi:MAG: alpha-glucan family phosphorylase, partial [Tidjanibacter sp.]|nr:alpha-glucan family phosphorylase [Tidjanibacter sp.]